jgi:hypothetical protein
MSDRSHLVPTPIVDATGKHTTVYKKPQAAAILSMIPAPSASPVTDPDEATIRALNDLTIIYGSLTITSDRSFRNLRALATASPETLDAVVNHIESAGSVERDVWFFMLTRGRYDPEDDSWVTADDLEGGELYRRCMVTYPLASRIAVHDTAFAPSSVVGSSVDVAEEMVDGNFGDGYANLRAAVIVSTMNTVSANGANKPPERPGTAASDTQYLAENIDAVERLLDELIERRTTDPEVVKLLLASAPALAEGTL